MDAPLLYQDLTVIAAFLLIYSLIAGRVESTLVNGPLLFLLSGWLLLIDLPLTLLRMVLVWLSLIATVLCTIILSVLLHGLTANLWVKRFKPR